MNPKMAGNNEIKTIPMITMEKFSLTIGMFPKKYPAPQQIATQLTQAGMLYFANRAYGKLLVAETKGIRVRIIGINLPRNIAQAPYLSKKSRAFSRSFSLMNLPSIRCRGIRSPNLSPKKKFSESPAIDATKKTIMNNPIFKS